MENRKSYYLFREDKTCFGVCFYQPDIEDMASRNEFFVESEVLYDDHNKVILNDDMTLSERTDKTLEELSQDAREQRDTLIDRVSREIERLSDKGEDASLWREYRIHLRDIPEQDGFPQEIDWGEAPGPFTGK